ncbi:MAG TPA: septation protein SepH [Streptosporangiaceae bacterium]|nr:septation protein SepH [Streptosporangiaceae bacterium]
MQELRFVAVSEDGRYAVLAVPGRSARFTLPIDERLRAVALGQTSRLAQYEIEVESPLRPKEIQARMRAGETAEEIADAAGIAVERVRWFEGPVLAERAYVADQAQSASVRRPGESLPSTPGPRLGEIVAERLTALGVDPEDAQWDAKKRGDGSWLVELTFTVAGRLHIAEWVFDPRRRHVLPADENAARMSLPGAEPLQPNAPRPGEATVTQLAPRLTAGHGAAAFSSPGNGTAGPSADAWSRYERPGAARPPAPQHAPAVPPQAPPAAVPAEPRGEISRRPPAEANPVPPAAANPSAEVPASAAEASPPTAAPHQPAQAAAVAADANPVAPAAPRQGAQAPEADAAATGTPVPQDDTAPAPPEPAGEQAGRQGRKAARGKRSSVPSWDEIMFGSSRQHD